MELIYVITPRSGNRKESIGLAKRACRAFEKDNVVISDTLSLSYLRPRLMDSPYTAMKSGLLMEKCDAVYVVTDEVTDALRRTINVAGQLGLPIRFFDGSLTEVTEETLRFNERISDEYRWIIGSALDVKEEECPFAKICEALDKLDEERPDSAESLEAFLEAVLPQQIRR